MAESTQSGIVSFGHQAAEAASQTNEGAAFRRQLLGLVPALGQARPPTGP